MITAVTQTLANMLEAGMSSIRKNQISLDHPHHSAKITSGVNLYCYDIRENSALVAHKTTRTQSSTETRDIEQSQGDVTKWYDLSFLICPQDQTALGSQQLLSEVLLTFSNYTCLPAEMLAPSLTHHQLLPIRFSRNNPSETADLWRAFGVPLKPAIYLVVTVPLMPQFAEAFGQQSTVNCT